jgi:MYXO-CTERM domain-containing protein
MERVQRAVGVRGCAGMLALAAGAMLLSPLAAEATTRASFLTVTSVTGVVVVSSNAGLTYTVTVNAGAAFNYNSASYSITDIIGFYLLSDDDNYAPLPALAGFGPPGTFIDDSSNSGTGAVAGWKSQNANAGLVIGDTLAFTFPNTFPLASVERIGFHVRLSTDFPGTPGAVTGNVTTAERIPTPGAVALTALGGVAGLRRRRR